MPIWLDKITNKNFLKNIVDGCVVAIVDFGCIGVGDPACDLVIAWTLLDSESRRIFKSHLCLDPDTWARASGWALWKALITITLLNKDKTIPEVVKQKEIIDKILNDKT